MKILLTESQVKSLINEKLIFGSKERIHLSKRPVTKITHSEQSNMHHGKPNGFWYSFGDAWLYNVKNFYFGNWDRSKYAYKVKINPSTVLSIKTKDELDNFIDEYGTPDDSIDWGQVANDFDGIEFPTYDENNFRTLTVKTGQKKYMFLYTMDIASGCIWNPDGVLGLKSFGERK